MKNPVIILFFIFSVMANSQSFNYSRRKEKFQNLPFGAIKPEGWIKTQMQTDLNGFVGNLDKLVPELFNDPIYAERLHKHSKLKELGNLKQGDAAGDDQYKWWNSETQSNWWDGYIRNVLLLNDESKINELKSYIQRILLTQDSDGYLGIYDSELRYKFITENGELWSKATLYRGLLAYYEFTHNQKVWIALVRAVDNVMNNYPIDKSEPFFAGTKFSGGVAHGLTFTDICEKMFQLTNDEKYRKYALFLYENFSENYSSEKDVQLANIINKNYHLQCHGVHTFEHIRPLIVAAFSSKNDTLQNALKIYLNRIENVTTAAGAPIGDEWIAGRNADETNTGYEYCSIHELTDSYCVLLQKSGDNQVADKIENTFFNAAQGARNPLHSGIAYLKTDNSYEMLGTKNGEIEPDRKQTRYKYSPAHQDVAVCCNPNAGRITPYYVQNMWMKEGENTLVATLLGPCSLNTKLNNSNIQIQEITEYPYKNEFKFLILVEKPTNLELKIRKPGWALKVNCNVYHYIDNEYIVINKTVESGDEITLNFETQIEKHVNAKNEVFFRFGALLYAYPIAATEIKGRSYSDTFFDYFYTPIERKQFKLIENQKPKYVNNLIQLNVINLLTSKPEKINLIPFGKTILRQVTFKK